MPVGGESQSTGKKTCPSAVFYTIKLTWIGLRWRRGLRAQTPETEPPSHDMAKTRMGWKQSSLCPSNKPCRGTLEHN